MVQAVKKPLFRLGSEYTRFRYYCLQYRDDIAFYSECAHITLSGKKEIDTVNFRTLFTAKEMHDMLQEAKKRKKRYTIFEVEKDAEKYLRDMMVIQDL